MISLFYPYIIEICILYTNDMKKIIREKRKPGYVIVDER